MKYALCCVVLVFVVMACDDTRRVREPHSSVQQARLHQYLQTAEHLTPEQRHAMLQGRPFLGMTFEEASLALTLVDWQGKFARKLLKARWQNRAGQPYVLFFDCGTPNRVTWWSAFTDEEVRELTTFREEHPCPPLPQR